jgi:hypothetical protein
MQRALRRSDRPLMLHWIAIGALVTLGVMIASVALAVYLGHSLGIDFASADESDVRSSGPLVLVGVAILAGFPFAGYLVARASAATSVLEPAMGAAVAIAAAVALLSLAAPVAVVFALAVAPLAFGLACRVVRSVALTDELAHVEPTRAMASGTLERGSADPASS